MDELHTGDTRTNDRQMLRYFWRRVGIACCQDPFAVGVTPIGNPWTTTGRQQDFVEVDGLDSAVRLGCLNDLVAEKFSGTGDDANVLAAEQFVVLFLEVAHDVFQAFVEVPNVDSGVDPLQAHPGATTEERERAAGSDHCFRGDAVPQVRSAADDVTPVSYTHLTLPTKA